ncbi:MAG: DUF4097 domain-containing protein [Spirochaetaceae bacterium]
MKKIILIVLILLFTTGFMYSRNSREKVDESYSFKGIDTISVSLTVLDIEVIGSNRNSVEIELINIPDKIKVEVVKSKGHLNITSNIKRMFNINTFNSRIVLHVPNDIELDLKAVAGDISVDDFIGDITSKTTAGDHTFNNVEGSIYSKTTAGDQTFNNVIGSFDSVTTAGDIRGKNITIDSDVYFSTTAGDIRVDFTNDLSDISFELSSLIGDIKVNNSKDARSYSSSTGKYVVTGRTTFGDQTY